MPLPRNLVPPLAHCHLRVACQHVAQRVVVRALARRAVCLQSAQRTGVQRASAIVVLWLPAVPLHAAASPGALAGSGVAGARRAQRVAVRVPARARCRCTARSALACSASAPCAVRCSTGCRWSHCSCAAHSAPACSAPARGAVCRSAICCWPCSGCLACSALACSAPASSVAFRCTSCSCCCCTVLLLHKRPGVAVHCLHCFAPRAGGGRHGGQRHCQMSLLHCQDGAGSGLRRWHITAD